MTRREKEVLAEIIDKMAVDFLAQDDCGSESYMAAYERFKLVKSIETALNEA